MILSGPRLASPPACLPAGPGTHPRIGERLDARKCKVTPLRASQSLSETFPGTGYKACPLKGTSLRGKPGVRRSRGPRARRRRPSL